MSRVPTNGIDYTSKDYESFRANMIGQLGILMPEYTDIRQSDAGIVILELLAQGLDILSYYQDVLANEVFLTTEQQRNNALKWCQMLGYTPRSSTPSIFQQVFVLGASAKEDVVIPARTVVKTTGTSIEPSIYFETTQDLIIPQGNLGDEQDIHGNYLYAVDVVQGITVENELLGSSAGTPNQTFKLSYSPAIADSVVILVNEGSGFEKWTKVTSFIDSSPTSRDYTVSINDNDEAVVTFGDGVFGKIPKSFSNGIFCTYRVGGGSQGNVGAFRIDQLDSTISVVSSTFNPFTASTEGLDKESLDDIKRNAPASHRTIWGALTASDFSEVTLANFPEVKKSASYATGRNNRDIDLYVLLEDGSPISGTLRESIEYLFSEDGGGRKIIGSGKVNVKDAIITPVNIQAVLEVLPRYDFNSVKDSITKFLQSYFSIGNYDFNTELSISSLCAEVMSPDNYIEGIRYFGISLPADRVLVPDPGVIYSLGTLTINEG